jgi:putative hemolysin
MIDEGSEAGTIEQKQREMLRNIFRLDDRQVSSIMVPRADILFLDTELSPDENMAILRGRSHSWFPLCRGGLNDLVGLVRTQQALLLFTSCPAPHAESLAAGLEKLAHAPVFVPESVSSLDLLKLFQERGMHTAFIVDEYGTLQGLVTLRDILEILAGQIGAPKDDSWAVQREDGSWLVDGSIPLPELKDLLDIRRLPDESEGHYSILSGMLMYLAGRIPAEGDSISCCGWIFEIVDMDGNRIDKILVSKSEQN